MRPLAQRLKQLREKKELSVSDVARRLGVSPSTYRDWEYGREIKGEPYIKICQLFNVSITYLLTGEEPLIEKFLTEMEVIIKKLKCFL